MSIDCALAEAGSWRLGTRSADRVHRPYEPIFTLSRLIISQTILAIAQAQTAAIIPANEAGAHVGEYATVEGVVAKVFTTKSGNAFLNIGTTYPNQTFNGWIPPASPVNKSQILSGIEGKHVKVTAALT